MKSLYFFTNSRSGNVNRFNIFKDVMAQEKEIAYLINKANNFTFYYNCETIKYIERKI